MPATHADVIHSLADQLKPLFESSPDGVYIWLDETHKLCNERMAAMFGYTVDEWCAVPHFLEGFIDEEDQESYARNYQTRVAALAFPVTFRFRGRRKDGTTFAAETDMIPLVYEGRAVAYHFVRRCGD
jgi:PAS domain S-box-containing protein